MSRCSRYHRFLCRSLIFTQQPAAFRPRAQRRSIPPADDGARRHDRARRRHAAGASPCHCILMRCLDARHILVYLPLFSRCHVEPFRIHTPRAAQISSRCGVLPCAYRCQGVLLTRRRAARLLFLPRHSRRDQSRGRFRRIFSSAAKCLACFGALKRALIRARMATLVQPQALRFVTLVPRAALRVEAADADDYGRPHLLRAATPRARLSSALISSRDIRPPCSPLGRDRRLR